MREVLYNIKDYQIDIAEEKMIKLPNSIDKKIVQWNIDYLKKNTSFNLSPIRKNSKSRLSKTLYLLAEGDILSSQNIPKDSIAFDKYQKALKLSISSNDSLLTCISLRKILKFLYKNRTVKELFPKYIEIYRKYAFDNSEKATLLFYKTTIDASILQKEHIKEYKNTLTIASQSNNRFIQGRIHQLIGVNFSYFLEQKDSALYHYKKAEKLYNKLPYYFATKELFGIYTNIGIIHSENKEHEKANTYYQRAKKIKLPKNNFLKLTKLSSLISNNYRSLKKYDSAFFYNDKFNRYSDSLNEYKKAIALNDIETKYQTVEKEKKIVQLLNTNLKSEAQRIKNRNWLIGSSSALVIGLIIAILVYKNTKRKQRIAEQEREIEIQKTEKLLKEQELTAIDAMISGQEKERQRLANDLHDNLGSTLATVKLHFDHLKNNRDNPKVENIEELYSKTNNLLDEAYQKVRTIAHEKNSGVMAKQGLLPAVKNLAKKASNGDGLLIEVQDYGLDERLDNALEISIFRIIQELITNTIKHANASEIHISLTNHDSLLNIIVEDNGKGFNAKILPEKDGMGLKSIEKRIEHMEGTFEIDSTIGKGTNIIINIPI
ncbi:sensor histidine kinase [uncultured Aquimarina sp.]|uniref:sensor histidine kinase n=1 Tax=uncultured Aquimarina sp. TaxID=575652 RepID=UPI00261A109B|nr:sensor histidine kinase [uncultured Aquimarina sp.]